MGKTTRPTRISEDNPLVAPYWERQKYERNKMYTIFRFYMLLPYGAPDPVLTDEEKGGPKILAPRPRSMEEVADAFELTQNSVYSYSSWWRWKDRVQAYDLYREAEEAEERKLARRRAMQKMEERQIKYRDEANSLNEALLAHVREMLSVPILERREEVQEAEDGTVTRIIYEPASWNVNTIARLASALERLMKFAGGADEAGQFDRLLEKIDPSKLSPEARKRIIHGEDPITVLLESFGTSVPTADVGSAASGSNGHASGVK